MSWQVSLVGAAVLFAGFCGLLVMFGQRTRHNRRINLPPPSPACRRNSTEAVP